MSGSTAGSYNILTRMKIASLIREQKSSAALTQARAGPPLSRLAACIVAATLVAIVFAVYSPAANFQFVLDDHRFLGDPRLQSSGHVWEYFTSYVWAQLPGGPSSFYRPVFALWLRAALVLDEAGRCDQAMPIFEQVIQQYPQNWFAWAGRGECLFKLHDLAGAEQSLRRASELSHAPRVIEQWQELRASMGLPSAPLD